MLKLISTCTAASLALLAQPAQADGPLGLEAFRVGILEHDIDLLNDGASGKEAGQNITLEAVWDTPDFLEWAFEPEPYAYFSFNTQGETNFGSVGLNWDFDITETFEFEIGFGYALHDGVVKLNEDPGDPDRIRLDATRAVLGSRDLFRTALSVSYEVQENIELGLVFEHYSHGQILGSGKNEGVDSVGLRLTFEFDD